MRTAKRKFKENRSGAAVTIEREVILCDSATVQARADIVLANTEHAGVVTHCCDLEKGHKAEWCTCKCGWQWKRFNDGRK